MVPVGTHDWSKFVRPADLTAMLVDRGFSPADVHTCGLMYNPLSGRWCEDPVDLDVNYITTALRNEAKRGLER